jgi:hypothetical protein
MIPRTVAKGAVGGKGATARFDGITCRAPASVLVVPSSERQEVVAGVVAF